VRIAVQSFNDGDLQSFNLDLHEWAVYAYTSSNTAA